MTKTKSKSVRSIALIALMVLLCVGLGVTYAIVSRQTDNGSDSPKEQIPLLSGEILESGGTVTFTRDGVNLTADGTLLMFEHLQRSSVSRLDVTNEFGSYAFVYDAAKDDFYLEGNPSIPYSEMSLISLMSDAGYAIVNRRVEDHCTDFSLYGLDDASVSASYTLTTLQGDTHTVLIGAQVPGSSYRYVRYAGRDAVYIARSSYAGTVMANVTSFVSPILATAMSTDDYYKADDFYLKRNGETVTAIRYLDEAAREQKSTIYEMTVPAAYTVNDTNYSAVLQALCTPYGMSTLDFSRDGNAVPDEVLQKYGVGEGQYVYVLHYVYGKAENTLYFSAKNEDGTYNCYSPRFGIVAQCKGVTFAFLDWDLLEYVSQVTLSLNINLISSITIESPTVNEVFSLTGTDQELQMQVRSTGRVYTGDELKNFRRLYNTILVIDREEYAENPSTDDLLLTLTIKKRDNTELVYRFYGYSTRRCYFTINGVGEFTCLRDGVEKVINDTNRFMAGEEIDPWGKN